MREKREGWKSRNQGLRVSPGWGWGGTEVHSQTLEIQPQTKTQPKRNRKELWERDPRDKEGVVQSRVVFGLGKQTRNRRSKESQDESGGKENGHKTETERKGWGVGGSGWETLAGDSLISWGLCLD